MKNTKMIIEKILLFVIFTMLIAMYYYKILPYVRKFGLTIPKEKEYIETDFFQNDFQEAIQRIESSVSWGIFENNIYEAEFNQYNRDRTNIEYILDIEQTNGKSMVLSNIMDEDLNEVMKLFEGSTVYYRCSLNEWPVTSEKNLKYYKFKANQEIFKKLDVYIRINEIDVDDYIFKAKTQYEDFANNYTKCLVTCGTLATAFIIILIDVSKHVNNTKANRFLSNLYIEQFILTLGGVVYIGVNILNKLSLIITHSKTIVLLAYIMSYIIFAETYFYAIRKKENKKGFLFPKIIKNIKSTYQPVLEYLLICICYLVIIIFFDGFGYVSYASEIYVIIVWIYTMVLLNELNFRTQIYEITKQVEMMRKGNMNVSIKCTNSELEELGENINHLKQGMEKAINESIKAERLKTDLITNVSHDLKTPLTSIINYTDLLKKEKIENENAKKYIDILEKKSKKLKILTEDLIEVSKISSGNETVALEKIDFKELVLQANGEFAEKFEEKNLEVISNLPKEAVIVDLDGKKMWRVLENLYQNVYKYSLENTRVYVDLIVNDHIVFTIKNISKEKLNISPDELMERFIRGDSSRHTGGNGLGLSIAKDLSKLNGGTLSIQIDGDLFVAKIKLDNIKLL
jgi:signal transduction histidine kinase